MNLLPSMNLKIPLRIGKLNIMKNEQSIYISGPMTGYENYNWDAFAEAALELHAKFDKHIPGYMDLVL